MQIISTITLLTRGLGLLLEVDGAVTEASILACWRDERMLAENRAFISCTSCTPSSSLNTTNHLQYKT